MVTEAPPTVDCKCGLTPCRCIRIMDGPQSDFFYSTSEFPGMFAGRRSGKTVGGVSKGFAYIDEYPGAVGVVTAPIFPQIGKVIMPVVRKLFGWLEGKTWEFKRGDMEIHFPTHRHPATGDISRIFLRPAIEPGAFRGMDLAFGYMDEISSEYQWEAFKIISASLTQEGFPPQLWATSTPDWRRPWVRKIWVEHLHPDTEEPLPPHEYQTFVMKQEDNYHLSSTYVARQKRLFGNTPWARQELGGEFIAVEGAGFPGYKDEAPVVMNPPESIIFQREIGGLDFGDVSPTALMEVKKDINNHVWVTRELYKSNCTDEEWIKAVGDWGLKKVVCDPSGGHERKDRLRTFYGVPIDLAPHKEWDIRYNLFYNRLQNGTLHISPSCINLRKEIPNLAFAQSRGHSGLVEGGWMKGTQDHAWDATCYALEVLDMPAPDFDYRPNIQERGWNY